MAFKIRRYYHKIFSAPKLKIQEESFWVSGD